MELTVLRCYKNCSIEIPKRMKNKPRRIRTKNLTNTLFILSIYNYILSIYNYIKIFKLNEKIQILMMTKMFILFI